MPKAPAVLVAALLAGGCGSVTADHPGPVTAPDFRAAQVRRPVFLVRFAFGSGFEDKDKQAQLSDYEGALLEGLNARAVLAKDVQVLRERAPKVDPASTLAKARELGADHVIDVRVQADRQTQPLFCTETRRPFRAQAIAWSQQVNVLRASDGATRMAVPGVGGGLEVYDFQADCDRPRESKRRTPTEALNDAVTRLLNRVVGP